SKTKALGLSYFQTAEACLAPSPVRLVALGGFSGTGKTTVASFISPQIGRCPGAIHLRSDIERKRLFGVPDTKRLPPNAYDQKVTSEVYQRLRNKASRALRAGQSVVVDAVSALPKERRALELLAKQLGVAFTGIWLEAPTPD